MTLLDFSVEAFGIGCSRLGAAGAALLLLAAGPLIAQAPAQTPAAPTSPIAPANQQTAPVARQSAPADRASAPENIQAGQSAARMDEAMAAHDAAPEGTRPGAGSAEPAPGEVLTMERTLQISKQHAPELRQAAAQTEAARARIGIARAAYLPQLNGSASYQHSWIKGRGFVSSSSGAVTQVTSSSSSDDFVQRNAFAVGLRLSQLIWDFGQVWNQIDSAKATALAQEQTERATQLEITYNVRSAFLTAGANKALREVAKATLDNQQRHLEQIQGFVEVGTRPQIDLAQSRTDVANAKLSLLRAENNYAGSKAELSRAIGVKQGSAFEVSDELPPPEEGETLGIDALVERGEKNRPEFASLQSQVVAERAALASIRGQYGPSLSFVSSADLSSYELNNPTTNIGVGLALTWPILSGGITHSRVDEANALLRSLDAQLEQLRADLRLAINQAVLAVQAAQAALVTAEELVKYSKERVTLAEGRYETGVGSIIELADAELALRDAQTQYVSAEYDLATARALLRRSLGRY